MTWTPTDSEALYNLPNWGSGYFRINEAGNLTVRPDERKDDEVDLYELTGEILRRGVRAPLLLRFDGILRDRVRRLTAAFDRARTDSGYAASYRAVYPIKVNQQRHVVEQLVEGGREHGLGLEVGSKPELLAAMGLGLDPGTPVICNGYKDAAYVEMALLASQMGLESIIVVEKFSELHTTLRAADELGIEPAIGVRMKPRIQGSGRWKDSGGDRSKFGLTTRQIVEAVKVLEEEGRLSCLKLLHFHIGSQVTNVRSIKAALREASRTLIGLHQLGAPITFFDVGGGLAVDYDGSNTTHDSSRNYSLQEYANDVVWHLKEACEEAEIPEPTILSESGRSLTAHHAVLITEVLGVSNYTEIGEVDPIASDEHETVASLAELHDRLDTLIGGGGGDKVAGFREVYHDAIEHREEAMLLFNMGQLDLEERARAEEFFWTVCRRLVDLMRDLDYVPEELAGLDKAMADTYFLNFSLFQSLPDSWAIHQLFPILPIHRHKEEPRRRATLVDVTCDSDGKVDRFISRELEKDTLEVHELRAGERYFMGFCLVGAYQEILGDMHNLFGDTNVIHVDIGSRGKAVLPHVVRGDRVQELLSYVEFHENELVARLRTQVEQALGDGRMTYEQSALLLERYERGLAGYSYLERGDSET
ncbi:MAG: biosynthetic arginine decarboxylase [Planctomycetota bacterium]|nr:biosynthetic arginine decarboxylase [Planctomycetota bacterium]